MVPTMMIDIQSLELIIFFFFPNHDVMRNASIEDKCVLDDGCENKKACGWQLDDHHLLIMMMESSLIFITETVKALSTIARDSKVKV